MSGAFLKSPSVSIANGSRTVTLTGNIDASFVVPGTALLFTAADGTRYDLVEGIAGTKPNVSGNSTITLRENWADPTVTNGKLTAFNTIEGLRDAIRRARDITREAGQVTTAFSDLISSTEQTITLIINDEPVEVTPYGYLAQQAQTLINDLQNASDLFDGLDLAVSQLTNDVATQQAIVTANLTAANAAKDDAENAALLAQQSEASAVVAASTATTKADEATASATAAQSAATVASDKESLASNAAIAAADSATSASNSELASSNNAQAAEAAAVRAETAADSAEASELAAGQSAAAAENDRLQTQDARDIALANANFAGAWSNQTGGKSPPYSVRHEPSGESDAIWMLNNPVANIALSEPSASNPDWFVIGVISGNVVNSVNGRFGSVILSKNDVGLSNVNNTSDANKPISTATQTALDQKANDSAVVKLTGNQNVGGVKMFSNIPVLPSANPTEINEATRKGYVDSVVDGLGNQIQRAKILALAGI